MYTVCTYTILQKMTLAVISKHYDIEFYALFNRNSKSFWKKKILLYKNNWIYLKHKNLSAWSSLLFAKIAYNLNETCTVPNCGISALLRGFSWVPVGPPAAACRYRYRTTVTLSSIFEIFTIFWTLCWHLQWFERMHDIVKKSGVLVNTQCVVNYELTWAYHAL